jgi:hypothetical protein
VTDVAGLQPGVQCVKYIGLNVAAAPKDMFTVKTSMDYTKLR